MEEADDWLRRGNPVGVRAPRRWRSRSGSAATPSAYTDDDGRYRVRWLPERTVLGVPYNTMVPGYGSGTVNTLRLWRARATRAFDLDVFNAGDYTRAVHQNIESENLTKVLYPEDSTPQGKRAAARAAVFLRRVLAEGRAADRARHGRAHRAAAREGRRSSSTTPTRPSPSPS